MKPHRRNAGLTLVELSLVVGIIGLMAAMAVPNFASWRSNMRVKESARNMADLLALARTEAIRTGVNHCVYFWLDAASQPLNNAQGTRVAAMMIRDDNGDGLPQTSEIRATVAVEITGTVSWGVSSAASAVGAPPTDNDPNNNFSNGWTFRDPSNNDAQWVVFGPDGVPRGFTVTPSYNDGGAAGIGTGGGGIYVTNNRRDYAIVLAPLGGVRVHAFIAAQNQWRN